VCRADNLATLPNVLKFGSLKLLEPSGPVKACNGIALPCLLYVRAFCTDLYSCVDSIEWLNNPKIVCGFGTHRTDSIVGSRVCGCASVPVLRSRGTSFDGLNEAACVESTDTALVDRSIGVIMQVAGDITMVFEVADLTVAYSVLVSRYEMVCLVLLVFSSSATAGGGT
jgi:hypothetical protein